MLVSALSFFLFLLFFFSLPCFNKNILALFNLSSFSCSLVGGAVSFASFASFSFITGEVCGIIGNSVINSTFSSAAVDGAGVGYSTFSFLISATFSPF